MKWHNGDVWGGLAAMLVALPAAIGFGVTIYAPLGVSFDAQGALAGILGATALGLFASLLGGTNRLISAPCAPAAAVLSALAIQFTQAQFSAESVLLAMMLIAILSGGFQIMFGVLRLGALIKYMPYPVVSGYLSGVGLIIISSQIPKWLGVTGGGGLWQALQATHLWRTPSLIVGGVTVAVMLSAPKLTQKIPAVILALLAGVLSYLALGLWDPALLTLEGNALVVGPLGGSVSTGGTSGGADFLDAVLMPFKAIGHSALPSLTQLLLPALTLAVLLSIDTLKTCLVLDSLTHSRHNSNKELMAQGVGNVVSAVIGGMPGAGTMGATLVNMASGAQTRSSGVLEGVFALLAFLLLAPLIAWIPMATLAAILVVIGFRMIDVHSVQFLKSKDTILDFVVVIAVVIVAQTVSLIAASGVGVGLALLLFVREQIGSTAVRRITFGHQVFSKRERLDHERQILEREGQKTVIIELQGSLFFGTADQLYSALEPYLQDFRYVILDLRLVQSVDVSAGHMIERIRDMLAEKGSELILSDLPENMPTGRNLKAYFDQLGLIDPHAHSAVFDELCDALEYVESCWLIQAGVMRHPDQVLELRAFELFKDRKADTLVDLEACMSKKQLKAGEVLFRAGDAGGEIYFITRGEIRLEIPLSQDRSHHTATHSQGDFFGEMSFLDLHPRSDTAVAITDCEVLALSRERFDVLSEEHRKLGVTMITELARVLSTRLRRTNDELRVLEST